MYREVPVVATRLGNCVKVSTFRDDSLWLANIEANPHVAVWIGGKRVHGSAQVTRGFLNVVEIVLDPADEIITTADVAEAA